MSNFNLIDGKAIAADIRSEIAAKVKVRKENGLPVPGLATVLVGQDPASEVYVRMKQRACAEAGIESFGFELPADSTQDKVEGLVKELHKDSILLPSPLG